MPRSVAASEAPLASTLDRLGTLDPWFEADLGRPDGDAWHRLHVDSLADLIPGWLDELTSRHGGHRDVAGSYLGGWFGGAAASLPIAGLVVERRVPDLSQPIWVRRHEEGWFDRVAFESGSVVVLPDDAHAGHPHATVVADEGALSAHVAEHLAAVLEPLLEQVRGLVPFGRRGLWGSVADEVASMGLWAGRLAGCDPEATWRSTTVLTSQLADRVSWLRTMPSPCRIGWSGGQAIFAVKGTCCLYFKTQPRDLDVGAAYCTGCPFRTEEDRQARLVAHMESSTA